ncbi:MAG TPA: hypothetical protein VEY93_03720 [Longimicrobium sp.]|jgi:hypothetical protein|nr:hypothetical protein [Longimicrobium sp.]
MPNENVLPGFDAVQQMRVVRDRISGDIEGMTFEEEKAYYREQLQRAREAGTAPFPEHVAAQ